MLKGLAELTAFEQAAVWSVLALALLGLGYAWWLRSRILAYETGNDRMREVWGWINAGARAYLARQFRTIIILIAVLSVALFMSVYLIPPTR